MNDIKPSILMNAFFVVMLFLLCSYNHIANLVVRLNLIRSLSLSLLEHTALSTHYLLV